MGLVLSLLARPNLLGRREDHHKAIPLTSIFFDSQCAQEPDKFFMCVGLCRTKYQSPHYFDYLQERNVINAQVLVLRSIDIDSARSPCRNGQEL